MNKVLSFLFGALVVAGVLAYQADALPLANSAVATTEFQSGFTSSSSKCQLVDENGEELTPPPDVPISMVRRITVADRSGGFALPTCFRLLTMPEACTFADGSKPSFPSTQNQVATFYTDRITTGQAPALYARTAPTKTAIVCADWMW